MSDLIQRYHELLTPEIAEHSQWMLEDQLRRRHLVFGDRPLCTVLRPRFFSPEQYRGLDQRVRRLMGAFIRAHEAAMIDPALRARFHLLPWEEQLVLADPGYRQPTPHGRLDFFWDLATDTLALTEYNAETPAGAGYNDVLCEAFSVLPVMRSFRRTHRITPIPARPGVATVLLDSWREFSGRWSHPRIAIVDWDDVPTRSEFEIFQAYLEALGLTVEIVDPRALTYRDGMLYGATGPIDLIYKRVLINELIQREGLEHPMVRAVRERSVCMLNPFRCKPLHKKASLAVLSDEHNAALFTTEQQAAIAAHIPWTRVVEERKTTVGGKTVDLLEQVAAGRERLVLKPNDDYGGAGIVLGWTVSDEEWQAAIRTALASPHIVQERVVIPSEPYPTWSDGALHLIDRMLDTAPFVVGGTAVEGCLTRLSTAALLNVTAGGGSTVPVFLVEPR